MTLRFLAAARPSPWRTGLLSLLLVVIVASACTTAEPTPPGTGSAVGPSVAATQPSTPIPSPTPTATAEPSPRFTNQPDAPLLALIPSSVLGARVERPAPTEFGMTPGDIGLVFGELGLRFESLVIAFVQKPRLSLYAVRVAPPLVVTTALRPYLAAAGQYVGINGLHPESWKMAVVFGKQVWMRGDDPATLAGTTLYCWSSGQFVFLLTGSSDAANRAMVKALPGQPAPTPTPRPSPTPRSTSSAQPSTSPSASSSG